MIIVFYECIVCGEKVGCLPETKIEKRCCNKHSDMEVKEAINKLTKDKE